MEDIKSISSSGRGRPRLYATPEEARKHKNEVQKEKMKQKKLLNPNYGKEQYAKYKDRYNICLLHICDPCECNGKFCLLCNKNIDEQTNFITWNLKENKPTDDTIKHTDLLTYITSVIGSNVNFPKYANKYIQYCNNHKRWLEKRKNLIVKLEPIKETITEKSDKDDDVESVDSDQE